MVVPFPAGRIDLDGPAEGGELVQEAAKSRSAGRVRATEPVIRDLDEQAWRRRSRTMTLALVARAYFATFVKTSAATK